MLMLMLMFMFMLLLSETNCNTCLELQFLLPTIFTFTALPYFFTPHSAFCILHSHLTAGWELRAEELMSLTFQAGSCCKFEWDAPKKILIRPPHHSTILIQLVFLSMPRQKSFHIFPSQPLSSFHASQLVSIFRRTQEFLIFGVPMVKKINPVGYCPSAY